MGVNGLYCSMARLNRLFRFVYQHQSVMYQIEWALRHGAGAGAVDAVTEPT